MPVHDKERDVMDALQKAGSGPLLINIIAKRVRQLQRGAKLLLEDTRGLPNMDIAIREFLDGKISYRMRTNI